MPSSATWLTGSGTPVNNKFCAPCAGLKQGRVGTRVVQPTNSKVTRGAQVATATPRMDLEMLVQRVQADFREFPGMQLTARQAQRLWAVDDYLLDVLVHRGVLSRHSNGTISHRGSVARFKNS